MIDRIPSPVEARRRRVELAFAVLAGWLALQNLLLLATRPWANSAAARVVAAAIVKAAGAVIATSWPWFVALTLATAVAGVALIEHMPRGSREVRRGR